MAAQQPISEPALVYREDLITKYKMTITLPISFLLAVSIAGAQVATNNPADRVYRNGVVFTADAQHRTAEALAVHDGRIVYIGDNRGLTLFVGGGTVTVDLKGRFLMPGLVDGHMHPLEAGL